MNTPSAIQVQLASLRAENSHLRSENVRMKSTIRSLTSKTRDLERQLQRQSHTLPPEASARISALSETLHEIDLEKKEALQQLSIFKDKNSRLTHTLKEAAAIERQRSDRSIGLERSLRQSLFSVARLAEAATFISHEIMPALKTQDTRNRPNTQLIDINPSSSTELLNLNSALGHLKLAVTARVQTARLMVQRAEDGRGRAESLAVEAKEQADEAEKRASTTSDTLSAMKRATVEELEELTRLHQTQLEGVRTLLARSEETVERLGAECAAVRAEAVDLDGHVGELKHRLEEEGAARARLASDLADSRRRVRVLQEEVAGLAGGTGDVGRVVTELRDRNEDLQRRLDEQSMDPLPVAVSPEDMPASDNMRVEPPHTTSLPTIGVEMAAAGRLNESVLAAQIMEARLQETQGPLLCLQGPNQQDDEEPEGLGPANDALAELGILLDE
eukprot:gnl/Dysnectes_brevis/4989_a6971_388.p1 GENE.gnl/Dysnectes_brevis/4989_a6971_388~~gnl/Dysnectes_brevis/4989_a6971_388.p1  ORF type:complete len:447 (-),score=104.46 gnl/Dysnectes_brevis/4989_a6971_388:61-1401(-)